LTKNEFLNHNSVCPLPWNGIYLEPDGRIKNCAISRQTLGNINQEPIEHIINNEINQSIRKDMLDNKRHHRCNACYQVEDNALSKNNNESNRSWYKKVAVRNTKLDIFNTTDKFEPIVLDLRWRNTCNYACVYCGSDLSSTWESLIKSKPVEIDENLLDKSKKYIFDRLESVKHVYLAGGEPLLMKDNVELLDRLITVNPDVEIRVNSNISNLNGPVFARLKKFKNVKWTISVDSSHEVFEYMRWPGNWNTFVKNLLIIKELAGDQINFNMVWCALNSTEILNTVDTLIDLGFHENMFIVQCLQSPTSLSVLNLPDDIIQDLKIKIMHRIHSANSKWWLYKSLNSMYNFLHNPEPVFKKNEVLPDGSTGINGVIEYLTAVDQLRKTNSRLIFKDLYKFYDSNQKSI
jgi:radical SAM protein with 4Fe4S-binding SPASM domain